MLKVDSGMLKVDSGGEGYHGNWARICDTCQAAASTLYCHTDSAFLCSACDERIHASNSLAFPHERVWICTACENAPAAVTCKADAASLCHSCDVEIHSANPLAHRHNRVPITSLPIVEFPTLTTCLDGLQDPMLEMGNEILGRETNEEIDEGEADSWLLLDPDENENLTSSGFKPGEAVDDQYLGIVEYNSTCTNHDRQQGDYNQQQTYSVYEGDNVSDSIVPVQSAEEQSQVLQHNIQINGEYEASKAVISSTPSSTQCATLSILNASILPKPTINNISNSYTKFPKVTAEISQNSSLLMPLQITSTNREAKVLKYREKRKARKFEKKIRYASRKAYAETRPRVKGRFARRTDIELEEDQMFLIEEYSYGIVPSY
ncbi:zinc finger protein CONSTANS-LIKE 2 [Ziziphus jujuba]|uniref:Zinc finger protein CONSTANS-LIKE 2 n=1 Tax=Ziziphus jujuba TaxID=326968 RepID=A0A6P4A4T8_ZIZJJ|nr:zinc finger protein CONSTANS-LIKE 2 [Ziziphus jujuba]